jgi:hypothetical protein
MTQLGQEFPEDVPRSKAMLLHILGTYHDLRLIAVPDEINDVGRGMGEIAVHRDQHLIFFFIDPGDPCFMRTAYPLLPGPVDHKGTGILFHQPVDDAPGPVGRVIIQE